MDPGLILWRASSFFLFFFPFFSPSLFQLEFKSWHGFDPYQIPIFFPITLFLFFPSFFPSFFPLLFLSSSNVFLPFSPAFLHLLFLIFFSHSFSFFFFFLFLFPFFFLFLVLVSFFLSLYANGVICCHL